MKIAMINLIVTSLFSLPVLAGGVSQGGPTAGFGFQVSCTSVSPSMTISAKGFFNGQATIHSDFTPVPYPRTATVAGTYATDGTLNLVSLTSSGDNLSAVLDISVPESFAHGQSSFQSPGRLNYSNGGQQTTVDFSCSFSKI
jgi:hypothetical protein